MYRRIESYFDLIAVIFLDFKNYSQHSLKYDCNVIAKSLAFVQIVFEK